MSINSPEHEARLEAALKEYLESEGRPDIERMKLWAEFVGLHAKRSPERVAEMERAQGLD